MPYYVFLIAALLLFSCGDKEKAIEEDNITQIVDDQLNTSENVVSVAATMPSVPRPLMENLWNNTTGIDYIMLNMPFSMSTDNLEQSRSMITHISTDAAATYGDCIKTATISYVGDSGILMEADLYFSDTDSRCNYFIFYENGQPTYANRITEQGYGYYKQIVTQVRVQSTPKE